MKSGVLMQSAKSGAFDRLANLGAKLDQNKFLENVLLVSPQMDQISYLTRRLPMRIRPQTSVLYKQVALRFY